MNVRILKSTRLVCLIISAMMLLILFGGCGINQNASSGKQQATSKQVIPTQIHVLFTTCSQSTQSKALFPEFEAKNPDIKIIYDELGSTEILTKISTEFASGGTDYDVMTMPSTSIVQYVKSNEIADLTKYINKSSVLTTNAFSPCFIGLSAKMKDTGDTWWGIPWRSDVRLFLYNTDAYSKAGITAPPKTWDELLADAKKLDSTNQSGFVYAAQGRWIVQQFTDWLISDGGDFFNNKWETTYNDPKYAKGLEIIKELNQYSPKASITYDHTASTTSFIQGKAAQLIMWTFAFTEAEDKTQSKIVGNVAIAPVPYEVKPMPQVSCRGLYIPATSTKKDAAWRFIEWLVSKDTEKEVIMNGGDTCPVRVSTFTDKEVLSKFPIIGGMASAVSGNNYWNAPQIPEWDQIVVILSDWFIKGVSGTVPIQTALDESAKQVHALMDKDGYYKT